MIITGALLAESASVIDNKLNIQGGVVDTYSIGPDRSIPVTLVVLIAPQPFDKAPMIQLTITNPSGAAQESTLEVPESSLGGEVGFVCAAMRISAPADGRYLVSVGTQGGALGLPLTVISR